MKLYIGGAFQGQDALARAENPGAKIFDSYHETIREAVRNGQNPRMLAKELCEWHSEAVNVADEVGSGVVPVAAEERAYREAVGRALCVIAQHSEQVTRVVCGIGVRIK